MHSPENINSYIYVQFYYNHQKQLSIVLLLIKTHCHIPDMFRQSLRHHQGYCHCAKLSEVRFEVLMVMSMKMAFFRM